MITLISSLTLFLVISIPVAVAILLASVLGVISLDMRMISVPTRMFTGIDSFVLVAVPFYILVGELMSKSGITTKLVRFSMLFTGYVRGGTAYGCVTSSVLFSGISGSAVGDATALGQIFIKEMPKEGYSVPYSAALVAAGSMLGPLIPPSITMIIYALVANVSVLDLFMAGIVPGLLLAVSIAVVVYISGRNGKAPKSKLVLNAAERRKVVIDGLLVMILPIFIVAGSVGGVFTPTEAGGVAVLMTLIIGCVIFKSLGKEEIWESLIATGRISASIYLILGASEVLSYVMTLGGMEDWMRHLALDVISDPTVFLLVTAAFVLLVGTFLEPAPATVLFVPIFVPAAQSLGVDQIQLGIVFVLTLTLGLLTPPVGLCLFVVQKIGNLKMSQLFRALIPFLIAQFVTVILLCLFTPLSTWLPNALK